MNLEEELKMATSSVPIQPESTPVASQVATPVQVAEEIKQEQIQAQAQVVQPTQTFVQPTVIPQAPVQPAYVQPQITPAQPQQFDMNNEAGVMQIPFGQTINTSPITFIKLNNKEKIRFTVLEPDVISLKFHYCEQLGAGTTNGKRIPCWTTENHTGRCCTDLGKPKARYYLPVLVYPTMPNDINTIIPNAKPTFKVLMTWDDNNYNAIAEAVTATGGNVDFVATGKDTYGGFDVRTQPSSYRNQYSNNINEFINNWRNSKAMIPSMVRENMTEDEYVRRLAQVNELVNNAPQNNYANYGGYNNYNGIM